MFRMGSRSTSLLSWRGETSDDLSPVLGIVSKSVPPGIRISFEICRGDGPRALPRNMGGIRRFLFQRGLNCGCIRLREGFS